MRLWALIIIGLTGLCGSCQESGPPLPDPAEPRRVSSDNFTIVTESRIDARAILADLEQLRLAALQDWGKDYPPDEIRPIVLTFIKEPEIYFAIAPLSHAAGYYAVSPMGDNIVIFDSPEFSEGDPQWATDLQNITRHEAVHALMHRHLPYAFPIWADEGLAEYYSNFERSENGDVVFGSFLNTGDPSGWPESRTLFRHFSYYPDFGDPLDENYLDAATQFYEFSHLLAHRLLRHEDGLNALHAWHVALAGGASMMQASWDLLSVDGPDASRDIGSAIYDDGPTLRWAQNVPDVTVDMVDRIDLDEPEYAAHLRRLVRVHRPLEGESRRPVYGRLMQARSDAADYHLARAYEFFNLTDFDQSRDFLALSLERDPLLPEALYLQAMLSMVDVMRFPGQTRFLDKAREDFLKAAEQMDDPSQLYLIRLAFLHDIPTHVMLSQDAALTEAEIVNHLDWLQTRQVHVKLPHMAHLLIRPFREADRTSYARELFHIAVHHAATRQEKENLWMAHAWHLKPLDRSQLIPELEDIASD
ncbi:MAG: hypothetical protein AAF926_01150 [Pseudomonadota bacterium]